MEKEERGTIHRKRQGSESEMEKEERGTIHRKRQGSVGVRDGEGRERHNTQEETRV